LNEGLSLKVQNRSRVKEPGSEIIDKTTDPSTELNDPRRSEYAHFLISPDFLLLKMSHPIFKGGFFKDQVLLVTGGGTGIGYELVRQACELGVKGVAICGTCHIFVIVPNTAGRREDPLKQTQEEMAKQFPNSTVFWATCTQALLFLTNGQVTYVTQPQSTSMLIRY
jgi:hypothetical protein